MSKLEVTVEPGESFLEGQRWYSIKFGDVPVFSELVYDVPGNEGERNVLLMFGHRLRELLERD